MATLEQIRVVQNTRLSFKNLLVATDFSDYSRNALRYAIFLARAYGAKICLAHVLPTYALATKAEMGEAQGKLQKLLLSLESQGIDSEAMLVEGRIGSALLDLSREKTIDLIITGTHGSDGIERLVLGSVAEEMVRTADCPVLTVGPKVPQVRVNSIDVAKIMYATDFSPEAADAVPYVIALAERFKAFTYLVHVLPKGSAKDKEVKAKLIHHFQSRLKKLIPRDWDNWTSPLSIVDEGDADKQIQALAEWRQADLIVLGAKRASVTATHFRAGLVYELMAHAPCPVMTLHTK